jgi:catechol 2,3-dioxygenase-like lactoylglutathione lyase family enzyme
MKHLALAVADQERSRRFYETYFGFGAGPTDEPIPLPAFLHFGVHLPDPDSVRRFRDRLAADGVPIVEEWDEPEYVSVKCRDPDGYVVEAAWEPHLV